MGGSSGKRTSVCHAPQPVSGKAHAAKSKFGAYLVEQGLVSCEALTQLPPDNWRTEHSIGRIAIFHGLLDDPRVLHILTEQAHSQEVFGHIAVQHGCMTEKQLRTLLAGQSVRACVELAEDLAIRGAIELVAAFRAVVDYLACGETLEALCSEPPHTRQA